MAWGSFRSSILAGAAASALIGVSGAVAQSAPTDTPVTAVDEVVVTAQKRAENIQDVPMSISAVSAELLRTTDAGRLTDIAATIPGLQVDSQTGQPGSANVTLRGITTADITSTTTAITIDDVPVGVSTTYAYAALSSIDLLPYDVDHVEVLKGPQGTLYGASSLGGLVKYVTTTPDVNDFSARVGGTLSGVDHAGKLGASVRAAVNLPIVPSQLAVSLSGGHAYRPGYINNVAVGDDDFNPGTQDSARLGLRFTPNERLTVKFTALFNESDFDGLGTIAFNPILGTPIYGDDETYFEKPFRDRRKQYFYSADISYDLGFATLTSVTGYSLAKSFVQYDASEIDYYRLTFKPLGVLVPGHFESVNRRLTQEIRLASPQDRQLQWLVGGFYNRERARYQETIDAVSRTTGVLVPAFTPFYDNDTPSRYVEKAIFGNLTWKITDAWDIGAGLRYSKNKQRVTDLKLGYLMGGVIIQTPSFRSSDDAITYAAHTRYHLTNDVMLYGRIATGYRPGGANIVAGVPPTFGPDKTINYEAGIKADLLERRARFNFTAFYIDWDNIHLTDRLPNQVPFTGNGGKAVSKGFELTSSFDVTSDLTVGLIGAYTHAKLKTDAPAVGASAGDRLPNTPRWSGALTVDWRRPITSELEASGGLAWRYVGARESNFPLAQGGAAHLKAYDAVDLTAGVGTDRLRMNLFVKNLLNKHAYLAYSNFGATLLQPRTIGMNLDWSF